MNGVLVMLSSTWFVEETNSYATFLISHFNIDVLY